MLPVKPRKAALEDRSESTRALQTFENNSNAFDQSVSALFWNELRADGTAGTAANALIEGLRTQNTGEVYAATVHERRGLGEQ